LGGGKTVFVKGLARGAGSKDQVSSPTFTISKEYKASRFDLHHFDFYRLSEPGIISLELKEVLESENTVVVIEWAEIIKKVLPAKTLQVNIVQLGGNSRKIVFIYPKELRYLLEGVKS
jgi:tRNA threonylcarbamoyladenosine biosynthesis protein TsaE